VHAGDGKQTGSLSKAYLLTDQSGFFDLR